ncbi:MAG: formylglycine-generating enzyme family protein [Crocinitomicaceae bacterium]|nr:formylglycine-generating enzyme family protein [Crocinitomicaceae bacterium]
MKIAYTLILTGIFVLATQTLKASEGEKVNKDSLKIINKKRKAFLKEFDYYVFIPKGSVGYFGEGESGKEKKKVENVNEFYMYNQELTNFNYLEFLYSLKNAGSPEYEKMLPDTNVWISDLSYNEPYVQHYFRHPAYQNYPVVGVSYEQAIAYCEWITDIFNNGPFNIFKKVNFRLPTELEWMYAAQGGLEYAEYPWGGPYIKNAVGQPLANCLLFGNEGISRDTLYKKNEEGEYEEVYIYRAHRGGYYMGVAGSLNDAADITAPGHSYNPNGYGLYNMAGNVSEMVLEEGITKGGSWKDPGYYLKNAVKQSYTGRNSSSSTRGFRMIMEVIEY